jgi:MFS family permease
VAAGERVTYRAVLRNREFAAILVSQAISLVGDQIARIALAAVVFDRSHSALAASSTFAVSYVTYLIGGPILSSLSDRNQRRTVMIVSDIGRGAVVIALAVFELPLVGIFALIVLLSAFAPAFDSARGATLPEVLKGEAYIKGNALCNLVFQAAVVGGFVAGGALLAGVGERRALLADASTFLVSAGVLLATLSARQNPAVVERKSLIRDTADGFRLVASNPTLRRLLGYALLGAIAVAAPESLAIPVARSLGGSSVEAGILTASIPAGFIVGSFVILRLPPHERPRLLPWLVVLSVAPLLVTPAVGSIPALVVLWGLSGLGSALQLIASAAYVSAAPGHTRGRAYGLATTALMAGQGFAQFAAGALSSAVGEINGPRIAVALLAGATLLALPVVGEFVRSEQRNSQANEGLVR